MKRTAAVAAATAIAVVVVGLAAVAFRTGFARETRWIETGPGPEARANPYLAAELMMRRLGLAAETVQPGAALGALPPPGATLLVPVARRSLEQRVPELIEWARAGGHLIVAANAGASGAADAGAEDALLAAFDVRTRPAEGFGGAGASRVAWPGRRSALTARLVAGVLLREGSAKADWRVPAGKDAMILHFNTGRGSLTVLASSAFLENTLIGEDDNAFLAWLLVTEAAGGKAVTIVASDDAPGLLAVLWRARPAALIGVFCLLAAFVWRGASRLGPVLGAGEPPRRSLREHVEATGRFLWRTRHADALLAAVRESLERDLRRRRPVRSGPAPAELASSAKTPARLPEKRFVEAVASMERERRTS